jgi:hypothetical protein
MRTSERDSPKEHHHLIDTSSIIESSTDDSSPSSLQSPGNIFSRPSYDIVFFVFFATNSHAYAYFFCLFVYWESEEKCENSYFVLRSHAYSYFFAYLFAGKVKKNVNISILCSSPDNRAPIERLTGYLVSEPFSNSSKQRTPESVLGLGQ